MGATAEFTYSVRTWDMDEQAFTPQAGIDKWQGLTLWELKEALKQLRELGYTCHRFRGTDGEHWDNDTSVLVERSDEQTEGTR